MSNKLLDTIRNARDGSMVDIRTEQGIDSFPVAELLALLEQDACKFCDRRDGHSRDCMQYSFELSPEQES